MNVFVGFIFDTSHFDYASVFSNTHHYILPYCILVTDGDKKMFLADLQCRATPTTAPSVVDVFDALSLLFNKSLNKIS